MLVHGADTSAKTSNGETPMHLAGQSSLCLFLHGKKVRL